MVNHSLFTFSLVPESSSMVPGVHVTLVVQQSANTLPRHTKCCGQFWHRFPSVIAGTDFSSIVHRQFTSRFAIQRRRRSPTLVFRILHVVTLRASKEMCWIDTGWHVATVANEVAIRDGAIGKEECKTMCVESAFEKSNNTIAVSMLRATPQPAFVRPALVDARPKPGNVFFGKLWLRHCLISLLDRVVRRAGSVDALPGFSLRELYQIKAVY